MTLTTDKHPFTQQAFNKYTFNVFDQNTIPYIELFWPENIPSVHVHPLQSIRGISRGGKRPTHFKWHNTANTKVTPELIEWIHTEFLPVFNRDLFLWKVSTHKSPKELQCHLLGLTNN